MTITKAVTMLVLGLVGTAAAAQHYHPGFQPDQLKGPPPGPLNEVMVLGTTHLSDLPESVTQASFDPLLDRLARWRPTAIATENVSGIQCDALRRYPQRYADTVETYCWDPAPANRALGLDVPAATAEADRLLATWPAEPTPTQRRRLAALFLAGGERGSALVQWLRLPEAERRAEDRLDAELVGILNGLVGRKNETFWIAAPLAARLGIERLYGVDDHSADTPDGSDPAERAAAGAAIQAAWDNPATAERMRAIGQLTSRLSAPGGVLDLYRAFNDPSQPMLIYRSDFGAAFMEPSEGRFGRRYLGYWETRNLRMAANMRDVLGQNPGMRMLSIVGASHKAYYEAYLNQMHDVRLVDVRPLLVD